MAIHKLGYWKNKHNDI